MNKQFFITILLIVLMSMIGASAFAQYDDYPIGVPNVNGDMIYYKWTNNHTELAVTNPKTGIEEERYVGNIVIPEFVDYNGKTYPVTSIDDNAFYHCFYLTSITIPNSVKHIGGLAFDGTAWLANQPDGVVYAGKVVLQYKGTMPDNTNIKLEDGTLGIAIHAFNGCTGLKSITIPNSVTYIGYSAFQNCVGLTSVILPNSVTYIEDFAFYDCSSLSSITFPNSLLSIGARVFYGTPWEDNLPDGLVYAGNVAYKYKGTMPDNTNIKLEDGTLGVAAGAFEGCSGLTSITIPSSVTNIGSSAFSYCSLTSVTIPNSMKSIDHYAFDGCNNLSAITIPNGVTFIGAGVFKNCSGLTSVTVQCESTAFNYFNDNSCFKNCFDIKDVKFDCQKASLRSFYVSNITTITLSSKVNSCDESLLEGCNHLKDIYCYAPEPPFEYLYNSNLNNVTLNVPSFYLDVYKAKYGSWGWKAILPIGGLPSTKLATPTITINKGVLTFDCGTDGADYLYSITYPESNNHIVGNNVQLPQTFTVSVYAVKDGYEKSDTATCQITISGGLKGDVDGNGVVNVIDHVALSKIILGE